MKNQNVHKIAITAIMGAVGFVLMMLEFPLAFIIPSFIKFDFSELPALITGFAIGPWWGVLVCFIKNALHLFVGSTAGVGELSNFILGSVFVFTAGAVYKKKKTNVRLGKNKGEKYIVATSNQGRVTDAELKEFIQRNSTLSEQDISLLYRSLATIIEENINLGMGVNLKNLGVFSPNFRTKGSASVEEVTTDNIEKVVVNFRPATKLRDAIDNAPVQETRKFKLKHE